MEYTSSGSKTVILRTLGRRQTFDFTELIIESRLGNTPREVNLPDNQLFITNNHDEIDQLIITLGEKRSASLLHKLETNLSLILFSIIATAAFLVFIVMYGIPSATKTIAYNLPPAVAQELGSGLTLLDKTIFDPTELSVERQQQLQNLAAPYIAQHQQLGAQLFFRNTKGPNAFALPGGEIVFTDDIIALAHNDDEFLAVLFHELGHLEYRHLLRRVLQDSIVTIIVVLMTGDVNTVEIITGLPIVLLDLSYSRDFETEADRYALQMLHKNNIDIDNFATIMQRLEAWQPPFDGEELHDETSAHNEEQDVTADNDNFDFDINWDFLSTHPNTDDRVKLVEEFKAQHGLQ